MAKELAEFVAMSKEKPRFLPKPWYNEAGDCVQYYFKNTESYRERVDDKLTLYRAIPTGEIVGCQIKGIRAMLGRLGANDALPFAALMVMAHFDGEASSYEPKKRRKVYDALLTKTEGSKVLLPKGTAKAISKRNREALMV
jgi:hypothetical protein